MSLEVNWEQIASSEAIREQLVDWLNDQLRAVEVPKYLADIHVTSLSLGSKAPEITIRDISKPFDDFYDIEEEPAGTGEGDEDDGRVAPASTPMKHQTSGSSVQNDASSPISPSTSHDHENDMQFVTEIKYDSDICVEVAAQLLMNYPAEKFISLPVRLKLSDLLIHTLAVVAYVDHRVFISLLCDISENEDTDNTESHSGNLRALSSKTASRIDVVKRLKVESELGSYEPDNGSILRSVGKIETFLVDTIRNLLVQEVGWPNWIEFQGL
ncbi:BA75_00275T0 [Komagataella pastoris]|uniref:Mitochondrial distribution and morphology protein 12 n=1 Tax=Komagataella pastoris TaxID=4922 RepID=A0A1B2J9K4_PICPA|nr:BA75_00275T0 [Komagataella pastoris]